MAKATIRSKSGAVITIEGNQKEVASILGVFEQKAALGHVKDLSNAAATKKEERKRAAASDLVIGLREDGFFDKPKGLTDIANALGEKGYIYPITTLSGVMLGLVQRRLLGRRKMEGKWVYGK